MKYTLRLGVFETNSSSVHTLCICTAGDFREFTHGEEFLYDRYKDQLIPTKNVEQIDRIEYEDRYVTYEELMQLWEDFDYYEENYTTRNGEELVAFGMYGHD